MLREAVGIIVEGMEEWVKELEGNPWHQKNLQSFIVQLRVALKASEGESRGPYTPAGPGEQHTMSGLDPRVSAALSKDRADRERRRADAQEGLEPTQRELVGAPGQDPVVMDYAPVPAGTPVGAKTVVSGNAYVLQEDGKLHYDGEATKVYRELQRRQGML